MADIELLLYFSTDRDRSGLLVARDGASGRELPRLHALGRGSMGPGTTRLRQNGSTPTKADGTPCWRGNGELRATHRCVRVSDDRDRPSRIDQRAGAETTSIRAAIPTHATTA